MTPQYRTVLVDVAQGLTDWDMWGRLGWREARLRYQRTLIGPFWTTLSLGTFVIVLGIIWSRLWNQDPKAYIPLVCSGMIAWAMFSSIVNEGTNLLISGRPLIIQLRISYTLLACALVWRNVIAFGHNLIIYIPVCFYAGIPPSWAMALTIPGLALLCLNGIWISLVLGLACARFRDIQPLVSSLLQIALFITPIFWSPQQLPGLLGQFEQYNVLFHYIEIVRGPMLGHAPDLWSWFVVASTTLLGWGLTVYLFGRFRRRIPYWL
jgi:ABC-type polysaccharide/polyol phosphate export permease